MLKLEERSAKIALFWYDQRKTKEKGMDYKGGV